MMESFRNAMSALSVQVLSKVDSSQLKTAARNMMLGAFVVAATTAAMAQDPNLLPQRSAERWGSALGGSILGEAVREAMGGSRSPVERAMVGIATEVGRNGGRMIAQSPYDEAGQGGQRSQPRQQSFNPMYIQEVDQLDTLALRAVFAYEQALNAVQYGGNSRQTRDAMRPFEEQRRMFEAAYRSASRERQDVRPWDGMQRALAAPPGAISMGLINQLASPMLARLQRPGGPGFSPVQHAENLDGLRQQMSMRHPQVIYQQNPGY